MQDEIWRLIPGFEGLYEASNIGRIKAVSKCITNGVAKMWRREKILRPAKNHKGYLLIVLSKSGKRTTGGVHRFVMAAFHGSSDLLIDHINGVKDDNRIENLRYCTSRENTTFYHEKRQGKSSKYVGVSLNSNKKWTAQILTNGDHRYLGSYSTEAQAREAYLTAKDSLHV